MIKATCIYNGIFWFNWSTLESVHLHGGFTGIVLTSGADFQIKESPEEILKQFHSFRA